MVWICLLIFYTSLIKCTYNYNYRSHISLQVAKLAKSAGVQILVFPTVYEQRIQIPSVCVCLCVCVLVCVCLCPLFPSCGLCSIWGNLAYASLSISGGCRSFQMCSSSVKVEVVGCSRCLFKRFCCSLCCPPFDTLARCCLL